MDVDDDTDGDEFWWWRGMKFFLSPSNNVPPPAVPWVDTKVKPTEPLFKSFNLLELILFNGNLFTCKKTGDLDEINLYARNKLKCDECPKNGLPGGKYTDNVTVEFGLE